jgi:hypothetical protein
MAVREALFFHDRLLSASMPFIGFVVNKVHPALPITIDEPGIAAALATHPGVAALGLSATTRTIAAQALFAAHGELETRAEADQLAVAQLQAAGGSRALLVRVPLLRDDVHDVARLIGLERYLFT